jgi:hypothetical protein
LVKPAVCTNRTFVPGHWQQFPLGTEVRFSFYHKRDSSPESNIEMAEEKKNQQGQMNIELSEEVAEGTYSNLAIINHMASEFVIDFVRVMPGVPKAKVKSRIVLTPQHAKRLFRALGENIKRYESNHGPIPEHEQPPGLPMNFGGPAGQA